MAAILVAIHKCLNLIRGRHLVVYGDNIAVHYGLRKRFIIGAAMAYLRDICMLLAQHDNTLTLSSTKQITLADLLSRGKWATIANIWPQLIVETPPVGGMVKKDSNHLLPYFLGWFYRPKPVGITMSASINTSIIAANMARATRFQLQSLNWPTGLAIWALQKCHIRRPN